MKSPVGVAFPARKLAAILRRDDSILARSGNETFVLQARYQSMTKPDTWYVAFGPDKPHDGGSQRSTRTFKSEIDAKLFAMQILAKGWSASAGTLNPHQPKRVVGASQVERWADPGVDG